MATVPEFPGNQHNIDSDAKSKKTDSVKKVEKVIEGEAVIRKKPVGKRLRETFVGGDAKSAGSYVFFDVLIPAAKDAVVDAFTQGIERIFYGESASSGRRTIAPRGGIGPFAGPIAGGLGYQAYNRINQQVQQTAPQLSRRARATHTFNEILIPTRHEADRVLDDMFNLILKFGQVTVRDFYDLLGITPEFTDEKYGWREIAGAQVRHVQGAYLIDLPKPEPLEN